MPNLTPKQEDQIQQVIGTMRIENMPLTEQAHRNLIDIASGKKTTEQVISEIKKRHIHE